MPTQANGASLIPTTARGFSVVELMVAMAISLLLLTGVVAIFGNSKSSYETTDRLSRVQENGRFALDRMVYDIRRSGFVGCARVPSYAGSSLNQQTNVRWNFLESPIRGFQAIGAAWTPALPAIPALNVLEANDAILVRVPARDTQPARVTVDMGLPANPLNVDRPADFQTDDLVLAYSCEGQAVFHVSGVAGNSLNHDASGSLPGNASDRLSFPFRTNSEAVPVEAILYYIRPSGADATINSLWRAVISRADDDLVPEELVEGVEQMQIQYGLDTNGDRIADNYVTADLVPDWSDVYSVSISLLVRSLTAYGQDQDRRTYQLLDVAVPAQNDRFIRQQFTGTATIRNSAVVN